MKLVPLIRLAITVCMHKFHTIQIYPALGSFF